MLLAADLKMPETRPAGGQSAICSATDTDVMVGVLLFIAL
jgi:hypothetical protein